MDKIPESFRGLSVGSKPEVIQNRFSGESVELDPIAVAMYDAIMGAERLELYDMMQEGLAWFRKYHPKAFMTLLD
tara:strand:- start:106 stop:330 length:225 start_codon:yes stop_codon:yes gene_type:complete